MNPNPTEPLAGDRKEPTDRFGRVRKNSAVTMNDEERRSYARGFNAGKNKYWPEHKPPFPPAPVTAAILKAFVDLRNAVDGYLAPLDPEDSAQKTLGDPLDAGDEAMAALTAWLSLHD